MNHLGIEPVEKQCHIATTGSIMNTGRLAVEIPEIYLICHLKGNVTSSLQVFTANK